MHEEVNDKTISISVKAAKMTASVLAKAMLKTLRLMKSGVKKGVDKHNAVGETSMKKLMKEAGGDVADIEITDKNIKSFDPIARKYGLKYSLKKAGKDKYYIFFKGRSVDAMTAAFKEYTKNQTRKASRPSVLDNLRDLKEQVKNMAQAKDKHKDRSVGR